MIPAGCTYLDPSEKNLHNKVAQPLQPFRKTVCNQRHSIPVRYQIYLKRSDLFMMKHRCMHFDEKWIKDRKLTCALRTIPIWPQNFSFCLSLNGDPITSSKDDIRVCKFKKGL